MRLGKQKQSEGGFDPSKVDVVSIAKDGTVELTLVQANAWAGSDAELQSFQEKVQTYAAYACDGGLVKDYAETVGLPWRIVVHSQVSRPDDKTQHVIDVLANRLAGYGGSIESRLTSM